MASDDCSRLKDGSTLAALMALRAAFQVFTTIIVKVGAGQSFAALMTSPGTTIF
jgi:hypothetical protein